MFLEESIEKLVEKVLNDEFKSENNHDVFIQQMKEHLGSASHHLDALKDEVFKLKTIAEKAHKYGAPGGEKLQEFSKFLDALYSLKKFLQSH
jgi:hypothetical protein